mgnify:FL=1
MPKTKFKYQDPTLSPGERAEDLLSRMSLEEKLGQIQGFDLSRWSEGKLKDDYPHGVGEVACLTACIIMDSKESIAKLLREVQEEIMALSEHHIPAIFHTEALTGGMIPRATSFPSGIGQASTWDPELQKKMAGIIRNQYRAVGITQVFAPVLDVSRDPRFGRQGESYGEDPTLASAMGTAYVQGMQNNGDLTAGVVATAKHFLGYMNSQGGIHAATCDIPDRPLREIFAKSFQAAITQGRLMSVMNCYSSLNGEPVAGSKKILTDLLRGEMGFTGFTVSDYVSVSELVNRHKICKNELEAGKRALEAGIDVELPSKVCYNEGLLEMIRNGEMDETVLDRSVLRILTAKFALGLFENPYPAEPDKITEVFSGTESKELSLKIAQQSLVLLKNDGVLPLKRNVKKIAVIGHHAASVRALFGGYSLIGMAEVIAGAANTMAGVDIECVSKPEDGCHTADGKRVTYPGSNVAIENPKLEEIVRKYYPNIKSLLEQLKEECPGAEIMYSYGYPFVGNDDTKHEEALEVARKADVVILTLGGKYGWGDSSTTGEGIDSASINLPECQEKFIEKLYKIGKPAIGIHFDGRPISSDAADRYLNAIIEAWSPAEFGAKAITSVIFGDYNPGGKLPVSVAYNAGQIPVFYNHENGAGYDVGTQTAFHSYVDLPHTPRYCFGYGLSYTTFEYTNLRLNRTEFKPTDTIEVSVDVKNTGSMAGDEIVQLYISDKCASMLRPVKELAGFRRISLKPGEKKTVTFKSKISQFSFLDSEMKWKVEAGDMDIMVGASSDDIRLYTNFEITSDLHVDGKSRGFYAEVEVQ